MRWSRLAVLPLLLPATAAAELTVTESWRTEAAFRNPESALYDRARDILYVSNVDGEATAKDGRGFISRLGLDGKTASLEWVAGLNGPKGMALANDRLYVADIDELVEIDPDAGRIVDRYPAPGAQFLNDVAADAAGNVYVSDMVTNKIHRLSGGVLEEWMAGPQLENPNGLTVVGSQLYVGSWGVMTNGFETKVPGRIKVVSLADQSMTDFGGPTPIGNVDGIEMLENGSMLATDWMAGGLMAVSPNGEVKNLLDLDQGSADLAYIPGRALVIIPMMSQGFVAAYRLEGL
ncbi:MAG: SMP-30/gluconolactonase/LRE family protein [Chromatiales bacterium]